jgi:hypothetical protein
LQRASIARWAEVAPDMPALQSTDGRTCTYGDLHDLLFLSSLR